VPDRSGLSGSEPDRTVSAAVSVARSKCGHLPAAWTPESVRPAPCTIRASSAAQRHHRLFDGCRIERHCPGAASRQTGLRVPLSLVELVSLTVSSATETDGGVPAPFGRPRKAAQKASADCADLPAALQLQELQATEAHATDPASLAPHAHLAGAPLASAIQKKVRGKAASTLMRSLNFEPVRARMEARTLRSSSRGRPHRALLPPAELVGVRDACLDCWHRFGSWRPPVGMDTMRSAPTVRHHGRAHFSRRVGGRDRRALASQHLPVSILLPCAWW